MKKVLIVDCFDSFTYNIFHYLEELNNGNCTVVRYDKFIPGATTEFSHVVLSPGPGLPDDYPLIQKYLEVKPPDQSLLGVCLGLQSIAVFYNGNLERLKEVKHGISDKLILKEKSILFKNLSERITIGHYHSWILSSSNFPKKELIITSTTEEGLIMSIEHKTAPIYAVQFHPESILTEEGKQIFKNWLDYSKSS